MNEILISFNKKTPKKSKEEDIIELNPISLPNNEQQKYEYKN